MRSLVAGYRLSLQKLVRPEASWSPQYHMVRVIGPLLLAGGALLLSLELLDPHPAAMSMIPTAAAATHLVRLPEIMSCPPGRRANETAPQMGLLCEQAIASVRRKTGDWTH